MSGTRMMCGVIVITRSVLVSVLCLSEKSRPRIGISARNGTSWELCDLSFRIRPARKFVSPSFKRIVEEIVRVLIVG